MSVMLRNNYTDFYLSRLASLDAIYIQSKELDESDAPWEKLFKMKKSTRPFENLSGVTGFGTFGSVAEGEDYPSVAIGQLADKKLTHTKYGMAWIVTEEMEDDDQDEIVASLARAATRAARFTKEVNFADVFNNSFGTETSADGAAICAAHTLYSGSSINNSASADFGVSTFQTAMNHFATLTDDKNVRVKLDPAWVVGNPAQRWVFEEVLKSNLKPYTTDNEINTMKGLVEPILWAELTDTDAWWLVTKPADVNGFGLRGYNRQAWTVSNQAEVKNSTLLSVIRARWSRGCYDWRQVYGSQGG